MQSGTQKRRVRLNLRALGVFLALVVVALPAGYLVGRLQASRLRSTAMATVRALENAGRPEHAVRHLREYVTANPEDTAALSDLARLLGKAALSPGGGYGLLLEAEKVNERLLRRIGPDHKDSQEVRRRLIGLYVAQGDILRGEAKRRGREDVLAHESRFRTAVALARELIERGAGDPAAHRLYAMSLEGLGTTGDPKLLPEAVREYEVALKGDPGDLVAADRLARLLNEQKEVSDPAKAERVLDSLLTARPDDPGVRLLRHNFFEERHDLNKAGTELEKAAGLAPKSLLIRLTAANDALRRGDTAAARRHIDSLEPSQRDDPRVRLLRGMIDFAEQRPEEAVEGWRDALMATDGSSLELNWWLAYGLIQMGRVAEAQPLIEQFSRAAGGAWGPLVELLKAETATRMGFPARAAVSLERLRDQVTGTWKVRVEEALGRAHEAMWDEPQALAAYRRASALDPDALEPRLAVVRLLARDHPDEAASEIKQGLATRPDEPKYYVALCSVLFRQQALRPQGQRKWLEFDRAMARATELAPKSPLPALLSADRKLTEGDTDGAIEVLRKASELSPRNGDVAMAYASALARAGKPEEALGVLDRSSKPEAAGDHAATRVGRAMLLLALGRGREAREALSRDVDRLPVPERPRVWHVLGQIDAAQGDFSGARYAYREFARLLPDDPRPKLALLDLAMSHGDEVEARKALDSLKSLVGEKDLIWRVCQVQEVLWQAKAAHLVPGKGSDPREDVALRNALKTLEGVLSEAPQLPTAHLLHGELLERLAKPEEAAAAYRRAWDRGAESALPRLVELLTRLGRTDELAGLKQSVPTDRMDRLMALARLRSGDGAKAAELLADPATADREAPAFQLWRATVLQQIGKLAEAETLLRGLTRRKPGELSYWLRLIRVQAARGDTQAVAETRAKMAESVTSTSPEAVKAQGLWSAGDDVGASEAFAAALERRPDDAEVLRQAAAFYDATGRRDEAVAALRHAVKVKPDDRASARELALLLLTSARSRSDWEQAVAALGPEKEHESLDDRLARATVLAAAPDDAPRKEAVRRLESLLADVPSGAEVAERTRTVLTKLLLREKQPARACEVAAVSATLGSDPAAILLYADALVFAKNWDEAARQLERLRALLPADDARVAALDARLVREKAAPGQAEKALEDSIAARSEGPGAEVYGRAVIGQLDAMGPKAAGAAERVARSIAGRRPASSWVAAPYEARGGHADEAVALCRRSAEAGDTADRVQAARTAFSLVKAPKSDPRTVESVGELLEDLVKREPKIPVFSMYAALLDHSEGRYDEAVDHYRHVLDLEPGNPVALNNLAWLLSEERNQPSEALTYIDDLIHRVGRDPHYLDTRGVILSRLNRHEDAIRDLLEATRTNDSALLRFHLARAYRAAGRDDEFRKNLALALKGGLNPSQAGSRSERTEIEAAVKP